MPAKLTTTSYAILGLLAVRPWTTYELAGQMQRALGRFWPRAESKLYEEPKKLVAHGLARASAEKVGDRPRTVYSITPKGRRALIRWLPTPSAGPVLEFEHLVKVFFAEHGSKQDLLATISSAKDWAQEQFASSVDIPRAYLDGAGPFPERLPWLILAGQFLSEFTEAVERWAEWAEGVVDTWPDDIRNAEPDWPTLAAMAERTQAHAQRMARR